MSAKKVNLVMPMAGRGQRFINEGYTEPKPLIKIGDKYIIEYVLDCMKFPEANFIFIVRKDHVEEHNLDKVLKKIIPDAQIFVLDAITQGAICTVLEAKGYFDSDDEMIIKDCDQVIDWIPQHFLDYVRRHDADGGIVTIDTDNAGFSYAKVKDKVIIQTAEKQVISNHGAVGIYYFKSGKELIKHADEMIRKNIRTNNEFYVCPVYNEFIENRKKILNYPVAEMWSLGTPEEFEENKDKLPSLN